MEKAAELQSQMVVDFLDTGTLERKPVPMKVLPNYLIHVNELYNVPLWATLAAFGRWLRQWGVKFHRVINALW